ncbi:MAG TPA: peptide chain release factor 3 [Planctomycetota bacterium]|nr:peptide chain release factor 3 [Planctomycetota bacterium]
MAEESTALLANEIARRRTFAIISHPDAGKTTLTEKLLLYSGLIRTAGVVKNRKGGKLATSDWMAMEQERGISITSSAMQFNYKGAVINVLDTPGHQDFSEDTYRTLTAADSAIMVIDAAKGVETQTRKLFAVCRLRGIPVLTFINKMDLYGRPPLELMAEVEEVLGIHACAMNFPVGAGREFVGLVERSTRDLLLFDKAAKGNSAKAEVRRIPIDAATPADGVTPELLAQAKSDLELLEVAGNPFDLKEFQAGRITPTFFGSAFTNFGVEPFFDAFVDLALPPGPRLADSPEGEIFVDPVAYPFSGYVFKIQANMNPKHRDSMAFVRICSGRFERDLVVKHHRLGREVRLSRPHSLVAQDRNTVDVAYPGDIVGLINPGMFAIGDTISLKGGFEHKPLPQFQPEVFARIAPSDLTKRKPFDKGMVQLTAEGAVQLLRHYDDQTAEPFVAAVGRLQFEVLQFRLKEEYGVETTLTPLPFECSAWLVGDRATFKKPYSAVVARDARDRAVVLFTSPWDKRSAAEKNPDHKLIDFA